MADNKDFIIDQFTRQAVNFSRMPGHNDEDSIVLLKRLAGVSRKDEVLDVACGSGIVACAFAEDAGHVTGIDITPAMLEMSEALASQRGLVNLSWHEGDIESLPFPDNSFSLVISRYAFHHFPRPDLVMAEMVRVCRPGGKILIADAALPADKVDAYNRFEKLLDPSHHRALSIDELQDLPANAGLLNVQLVFYKMEMDLDQQISVMFPNPGDDEQIRRLFREDIGVDRLGVGAHLRGDRIHFAYPITVLIAEKGITKHSN